MMNSDHSEVEEEDLRTKLLMDSTKLPTAKRPHTDSEDEQDVSTKRQRRSSSKEFDTPEKNNTEITSDKNGIDGNNMKEENNVASSESKSDQSESSLFDTSVNKKNEDQEDKLTRVSGETQSPSKDDNNCAMDESPAKIKENITSEDSPSKESDNAKATSASDSEKTEEDNMIVGDVDDCKENSKGNGTREKHIKKSKSIDTEVVEGLELSVECASDKEASSSESDDEKDKKPRPKTQIIKAEPNESELECGSSDNEKSDTQEANDAVETKSKKRGKKRGARTSFSKMKASGSEDSQNNNSDEDYSPRTKKRMKKSPATKRSAKRSTESKRGRGGARRNAHKKNTEDASDDENSDTVSPDKTDKKMKQNEAEEELSGKESSASKSDGNSDNEENTTKSRRTRRSNTKPEDNKQIQSLKKYIKAAGIRVKCYQTLWADCRNNTERINCLKELLEKNGITGRPTLEKCKRAKKNNEKIQEISELDTSNIISEGRVTRARRNMESNKKSTAAETPPRHREARNAFKRLRTVVDSDSD